MSLSSGLFRMILCQLAALAVLLLLAPLPASAQGQGTGGGRGGDSSDGGAAGEARSYDRRGIPVARPGAPVPAAVQVAGLLNRSASLCGNAPREYRLDCVVLHLRRSAAALPQYGGADEPRQILNDTANRLEGILRKNLDPARPKIRLKTADSPLELVTPRLRAVKKETARAVNREAAKVLAEAETLLLRSASRAGPERAEFTRIAAAVGSNKLLLRS